MLPVVHQSDTGVRGDSGDVGMAVSKDVPHCELTKVQFPLLLLAVDQKGRALRLL